ncbi:acyl-CoA dehydrogenase [Siccirubricoccus deserti]|uniref:Acyl-CoA dehydrogenase family protein n=1 Tax=Siccirubricoccus deserti TaxID=2013562 RepID=A0A9X0QUJ8_9PROT|nr:acyl-CoA dehydrogenase family protein [Siccirubricoccus deserti]MBC4013986.1 acyl-CoA dehydrogenase family protein [Siccirubricoccus deserti]GGC31135.1 acyl-CoA dehydrogenase [Siccirubricoccus deserti]
MDFAYSDKVRALQARLLDFMDRQVLPADAEFRRIADSGEFPLAIIDDLKAKAQAEGLWNLFLPGLKDDEPGTALTNLEYAPLAEIMGRVPWASEVFNCNAPDTGNMEVLHLFATPEQRERYLDPLLRGEIRSCVAMTEPDTASSDPTNIATSIRREAEGYVINGRKWFTTGAIHPNAAVFLVMGRQEDRAALGPHERHTILLVPKGTAGVTVVRNVPVMGHHAPEGHCEVLFQDARVPLSARLGEEGAAFALMQARLGPGRIHHCMRTIGQCELALELMTDRALERVAFGKHLAEYSNVQDWIAESRIEIDQVRLLVLRAAWLMDREGNKAARVDVSAIKLAAARLQTRVVDRAMQVFGAMGLTPDTPLAYLYAWGRALRFIDGPDEVHLRTVARAEIKARKSAHGLSRGGYFPRAG